MKKTYFPSSEAARKIWSKNLIVTLPAEAAKYGIPADVVAKVLAGEQKLLDSFDASDDAVMLARKASSNKRDVQRVSNKTTRRLLQQLRINPDVTDETKSNLQMLSTAASDDFTTLQPKIRVTVTGNKVRINFSMLSAEAMNVYCRLGGTGLFTLLASVPKSPYFDVRPPAAAGVPQLHKYYVMPVINNTEVGLRSETKSVSFGG